MSNYDDNTEYELIIVIVNYGMGSKVLKTAAKNGGEGGAVFLGKGTMRSRINELLGLNEIRKEIVVMRSPKDIAQDIITVIVKEFNLRKPNHGIAMIMPLPDLLKPGGNSSNVLSEGENEAMYTSIITVVGKGKAELVMDAAIDAGARGGTVINARGAGRYDTAKLFNIDIEPEREIVMILAENSASEKIAAAIRNKLGIGESGNGLIFFQDVSRVYGLY